MTARDPIRLSLVREELEKTYGTKIFAVSADLTVPEERRKLYEEVKSAGITVDTLINNAGIGFAGVSWETEPENDMRLIRLNDEAVVDLCHMYLPEMIERRSGTVINIASTGAFQPGPYIASYYASKSFVVSYSQAVNYEARPFGVRVIAYCPGPVDTAFYDKSKGKLPPLYSELLFIFDLTSPEIYQRQVKEDGKVKNTRTPIFPEEWKNQFGQSYKDHQRRLQVGTFDGYTVFNLQSDPRRIPKKKEEVTDNEQQSTTGSTAQPADRPEEEQNPNT